ncbi:putative ribonuclease H-like domain-containing protein [Tanacetum coccineum]
MVLHINFLENKPNVAGSGPEWLFDIDLLTNSMNYEPVTAGNQTNKNAGIKDNVDAVPTQQYILLPLLYDSPQSSKDAVADDAGKKTNEEPANEGERNGQEKEGGDSNKENDQNVPSVSTAAQNFTNANDLLTDPLIPNLEDTGIFSGAYDDEDVGVEADLNNLETIMNTLVDLPKGCSYGTKWVYRNKKDEIEIVVRNKDRLVAQGYTQEEGINYDEVFALVARIEAISFEDLMFPDKVYKVEKALYGLHQAPKAWYETLSTYLLENGYRRGTIDKNLFIKKDRAYDAQEIPDEFYEGVHFLLRVASHAERMNGFFISQAKDGRSYGCRGSKLLLKSTSFMHVKRIFRILKGQPNWVFGFLWFHHFDLSKLFLIVIMLRVALQEHHTTGAEYVVAANCCGQNLVFHSKTKHIEIRHHFIRDSYEKKLIQVIKIHTDHNVADLLTKAFDSSGPIHLVKDETVYKEWEDIMERATTTASSLEAEQDSGSGPGCQDTILGGAEAQIGLRMHLSSPMIHLSQEHSLTTVRHKLMLPGITSYCEVKTVNGERQIQALVYKKKVIISETSIRSDLKLDDAEGTKCLPTTTIFAELEKMGTMQGFFWKGYTNILYNDGSSYRRHVLGIIFELIRQNTNETRWKQKDQSCHCGILQDVEENKDLVKRDKDEKDKDMVNTH